MRNQAITRRSVIRSMIAGAVSIGAASKVVAAQKRPVSGPTRRASATGAIFVERQPTGSEIWQVTTEEFDQSNIYCESPYCSGDSRYFVYQRHNPKLPGRNQIEFMAVELGTWKQHRLDVACGSRGSFTSHEGVFYYWKRSAGETLELMRADLSKGVPKSIYSMPDEKRNISLGTVSVDGRYYAQGKVLDEAFKMFGIMLIDLRKGEQRIIDRDPFILNPHPQFEPGTSEQLLIQHNRGGRYSPEGKIERLVGPEGATLYLLSVPDGKRTELQVGKPYTTPATGHQTWAGKSREIALTVSAQGDYAPSKGNLLRVRAGQPASVLAKGYSFMHLGVSRCGRLFSADDWQGKCKLVIGSLRTGKTAVVCEAKTSRERAQNTHAHAYLTPDLKWVIFNSDRSGFPHVHAASIPDEMIEDLLKA